MEKTDLRFAAINKTIESLIKKPTELKNGGKGYVRYGDGDDYLDFLYSLFSECPVLSTILTGSSDYVVGNGVVCNIEHLKNAANKMGETWDSLISKLSFDYLTFGMCYVQVIRNNAGVPSEFYHLDARYVRSDEDNEVFYYNQEFGKKWGRSSKTIVYPRFNLLAVNEPSSIAMLKTTHSRGVYGTPIWHSAIKEILVETKISTYNLSEIENHFNVTSIINFNNGQPNDEQIDEIEKAVNEKFCGAENGSRLMLSFNNGKDNATTVEKLSDDKSCERYIEIGKKTQKDIFMAFGASPAIFGVEKETSGFSDEDYQQSFKLYNRTKIMPIQKKMIDLFDFILGSVGSLSIKPFSIDWSDDAKENNVI